MIGETVTMARRSLGLTETDLASRLGITQAALSRYERGTREVSADIVDQLSAQLKVTPEFLTSAEQFQGPLAADVHMRRRATAKTSDWRRAEAQVNLLWIQAHRLSEAVELTPHAILPSTDPVETTPEEAARLVRGQWHMPSGPVTNVVRWMEAAGIFVMERTLGTVRLDGLSQRRGATSLVLLNNAPPVDRRRWTLAHELGHLVMHADYADTDMEKQANAFAAEFLMPEAAISPYLRNPTLGSLQALKQEWRVSMQALIQRATSLGRVTRSQQTSLYKQLGNRGWRTREPGSVTLSEEHPQLVKTIVDALQDRHIARDTWAAVTGVCPGHPAALLTIPENSLHIVA